MSNFISIWYEKYKPQTIQDLILPQELKDHLQNMVNSRDIPNISMFSSIPGCGKSSIANAIISETQLPSLWINASLDKGIDVIRGEIMSFASAVSFEDTIKIVVMDEFDNFTKDGQSAFRGFLDEFSGSCRFIFTGNSKSKVLEPLLNRTEVYDFNNWSLKELAKPLFSRLSDILKTEKISFQDEDVVQVIRMNFPSIRAMIGSLQRSSTTGTLKLVECTSLSTNDTLKNALIAKDFEGIIQLCNNFVSPDDFYTYLYNYVSVQTDELEMEFKKADRPNIIVTCAKYAHMSSMVRDKNLNLAACILEIIQKIK